VGEVLVGILVEASEKGLVVGVEAGIIGIPFEGTVTEADKTKRGGGQAFEGGVLIDASREVFGESDVMAEHGLESANTVAAKDKPKLECAKAPTEGDAPIPKVHNLRIIGCFEIFGAALEGCQKRVDIANVVGRTIEICEQPLVRIEDETIGIFDALEDEASFGQYGGCTCISSINMKPSAMRSAYRPDGMEWIDGGRGSGSQGGDHTSRLKSLGEVLLDGGFECRGEHRKVFVGVDLSEGFDAKSCEFDGFVYGRMGFF
jgi:hypothetical protein